MKNLFLFFCFSFNFISFAQNDTTYFDNYQLVLNQNHLVVAVDDKTIYNKTFYNPSGYSSDLDDDGVDEYLVLDSTLKNNISQFILFIFKTSESFSLVDSIISGSTEPYETTSSDLGGTIIIAGNPDFEQFNRNENYFLPINCWRYEGTAVFLVNDEIYNIFLNENENIINFIDDEMENRKSCDASSSLKGPIAAVYANYINAGENSVASQFLKNYYVCEDINQFKQKITDLLKKE